jgi:hypothetical protein
VTTSLFVVRPKKTRELTAWLVGGVCFVACTTYEVPEKVGDDEPAGETAGSAGKGNGGFGGFRVDSRRWHSRRGG